MITFKEPFLNSKETLICFGDSLTAHNFYVEELQKRLPENTIINAGRGGDKTTWALTRFQQDVIDRKPDALLIFLGTNDALIGRGEWADEPMIPPEVYSCNLVWMIHLARLLGGIKKISIATPFGCFEGPVYRMHGDILRDYCLAAREAASKSGCPLIPLDSLFWEMRPQKPLTELILTKDGCHPTEQTYRAMADFMLKSWNMQ